MPRPIQRWPRGLVDLLGLKDQKPFALADDLVGSIESFDLIAQERYSIASVETATGVEGATIDLEVPAGQFWFVYHVAAIQNCFEAGDVVRVQLELLLGFSSVVTIAVGDRVTAQTSLDRSTAMVHYQRPFVMRPGDLFRARVLQADFVSAPSQLLNIRAAIARFGPESGSVFI